MSTRVMVPTDKLRPSNYREDGDLTELHGLDQQARLR